jgi:hypothetical protein
MSDKKNIRARVWTLIVYPDSAPENWRSKLDELHIGWVESPLHDKDTNPDGTLKKAHWHVVLIFQGNKAYSQIVEIAEILNAPVPQKVASLRGMIRYLIHMDNPEKYQYSSSEIRAHGGADIDQYLQVLAGSQREMLKEIVRFIQEEHITSVQDLAMAYIDRDAYFDIITNKNTLFLREVVKGEWRKLGNH